MKLYVNIYPKVVGGLSIIGNMPGIFLKNLEKSWKYHGISSTQKCGNPETKIRFALVMGNLRVQE